MPRFWYFPSCCLWCCLLAACFGTDLTGQGFDPRYTHREANKKIDLLVRRFDSLAVEEQNKAEFIANVKRIFNGDTLGGAYNPEEALRQQDKPIKPVSSMKLAASDSIPQELRTIGIVAGRPDGSKYRELRGHFFLHR